MSGVFGVLIFALLFAIVMVNTAHTHVNPENKTNEIALLSEIKNCTLLTTNSGAGDMCDVICSAVANLTKEVNDEIDRVDSSFCSLFGYHLRYEHPQVTNIGPGWFKTDAIINKVTIRDIQHNGTITDIEPGAFNDCTFRKMTALVIRRTIVTVLKRGVFEGASSLKNITIEENDNMQLVEEHTLDPLYQLEEIRMTHQTRFGNLLNFTGTSQLNQLRVLTLSSNSFGASLNAETFRGCTSVETINLSNSSIQTIGNGTFDHMIETLTFLDLSNNHLTHLPADLLQHFVRPEMQISLSNNFWQCDCGAVQLQSWYVQNSELVSDCPLMCDAVRTEQLKVITEVDLSMCEWNLPTTAPTDTTKTSETTPSLPTPYPLLERLDCWNEKYSTGHLYLQKVYQYFSVKQVEMGKVIVEITAPDSGLSMVVINDKDEAECRYDINRQMTFDHLDPHSAHIFCLMQKTSHGTSPRNCYPFIFEDAHSVWGHDDIIIILVCSIVLSLVVGLLTGWLLSYRFHRLFKAKESLQYQSSARSTSKTATEIEDFHSSITSDYLAGKYGLETSANIKRLRRTFSDNSIISCKSYITAVPPSPFEIIQWKLRKNARNSNEFQVRDYLDKLECDCLPPPLPPHPNRRHSEQIYETVDEAVYTGVVTHTSQICPYRTTYA